MATAYQYGIVTERRLIAELRELGYEATRGAGSKGWDVIAVSPDKILFCSVKRTNTWKRAGTVYRAEKKHLEALTLPKTPKIKKLLAIWSDELNPETPGRGGIWYALEEL